MRIGNYKTEDRILLKRAARDGCSASLTTIYLKYQPMICDFLQKNGADDIAEDICQSVFMEIHEGRCKYDGSSEAKSFLFGVANNFHKNHIRSDKKKTYSLLSHKIEGNLIAWDNSEGCPLESLQAAESRQIIQEITAELPPKANQAIDLVYLKGIPAAKAADLAGSNFNTFRKRIELGLRHLYEKSKNLDL